MSKLIWEDFEIPVRIPKEGYTANPRLFSPDGKRLYCAYDSAEFHRPPSIDMVYSDDDGLTWCDEPITVSHAPDRACANPAFTVLDGEVLIAHRAVKREDTRTLGKLMMSASRDMVHWRYHSTIIEEDNEGFFGVWEPQFLWVDGKLAAAYSNDSRRVVPKPSMQNLEYKIWEGDHWGEVRIISDGEKTGSRDGMPVWDHAPNGIALVLEATVDRERHPFVIQQTNSRDLIHWTDNRTIYVPKKEGRKAGAPYLVILPDGRGVVSFQTDEDSTQAGDAYSVMKIMESKVPWHDNLTCEDFTEPITVFDIPDGYNSLWTGMYLHNGYLYACAGTNYPTSRILLRRAKIV